MENRKKGIPSLKTINGIKFTFREIEVLACILGGRTAKKIASFLLLSPKTVENYIHNIKVKLDCHSQEHIRDFLEKSNEAVLLREHYALIISPIKPEILENDFSIKDSPLLVSFRKEKKNIVFGLIRYKKWTFYVGTLLCLALSFGGLFYIVENAMRGEHVQTNITKENVLRSDLNLPTESFFLDRPNLLKEIEAKLNVRKNGIQTLALLGPGGSGKTTLARQYAHKQSVKDVWEINAETSKTLNHSFEKLAYALAKTDKETAQLQNLQHIKDLNERREKTLFFVKERLKLRSNWLLIYDNVEQFTNIIDYFPNDFNVWGEGKVIVTTRDSNILSNKYINDTIQIKELSQNEKLDLFLKIQNNGEILLLGASQVEKARKFLGQIPPYPLDVSIASYYIKTTNISYEKYLDYLKKYDKDFEVTQENIIKEIADYTKTRYSIIRLSLKEIIKEHRDFEALLMFLSILNSQDIPRDLLDKYKGSFVVDNFIFFLKKYSLLMNESSSLLYMIPTISIHRSTQKIILSSLSEKLNLYQNNNFLTPIFNTLRDYTATVIAEEDLSRIGLLSTHYEMVLNHTTLLTKELEDLISCDLGCIYFYLGNYTKANGILERVLATLYRNPNKYFLQIAQALSYLGIINREVGDYEKAKEFLEKSVKIYKDHHCENHIGIAKALSYLGLVYKNLADHEKAKELLEESLRIYKKHFPQNHIGIARTLSHLGINYREVGDYEKAKELLEESLSIYKNNLPKNNVFVARTLSYLGIVYRELGNYEKTKNFLEESLVLYKKYFPENYLDIAVALTYLGNIYRELGDYEKSKSTLEESILIYKNFLPLNRFDYVLAITYLGKIYRELGNYKKSKDLFEESLKINKESYSENHLDVAWVLVLLGHINKQLGDYEKAKDLIEQALKIHRNFLPENHIDIVWNLAVLGDVYGYLGLHAQAKSILEKAFEDYKKYFAFKENHVKMAWILLYLGTFYKNSKNYEKAKEVFEKCLSIYEANFGRNHIESARILRKLGEVYLHQGHFEIAENLTNDALKIFQRKKHPESFMCLENLAELCTQKCTKTNSQKNIQQCNDYKIRSIDYLKQALEIAKIQLPEDSRHIKNIQIKIKNLSNNT